TATVTSPLPRPLPASCSPQRSDRRGRRTRASFPTDMLSLGEPWTGSAPRPESAWRLRPPKAPVIPPWALPDRWRLEHCSGVKANIQPGDVPRLVTGQEGHEMADVLGIDVWDGHGLHQWQGVHDVLSLRVLQVGAEGPVDVDVMEQVGVAIGGMDTVHPDHARSQLQGQDLD